MSQDSDISWPVLRRIVQEWAGSSAELAQVTPLDGGCISTTLALTLADGAKAVLKISAHRVDKSYQREAHQLELLRAAALPVPDVYKWKIGTLHDPYSYLLMEHMDGINWAEAQRKISPAEFDDLQADLATLLHRLHNTTAPRYGRAEPETGDEYERWSQFYHGIFEPIWKDMEKSPLLSVRERKIVNRVRGRLDHLLEHNDCPRLVHWDVWASNLLVKQDAEGRWRVAALLDPHCKFAHVEAELAYMELFHTVGPAFFKAYQRERKLGAEYHQVRKPVYQLHSLLNHVHLFGDKHAKPLAGALERVAALV